MMSREVGPCGCYSQDFESCYMYTDEKVFLTTSRNSVGRSYTQKVTGPMIWSTS